MILIHFRFIHRKSYKQQKYSLPFSLLFQNAIDLIFPKKRSCYSVTSILLFFALQKTNGTREQTNTTTKGFFALRISLAEEAVYLAKRNTYRQK